MTVDVLGICIYVSRYLRMRSPEYAVYSDNDYDFLCSRDPTEPKSSTIVKNSSLTSLSL